MYALSIQQPYAKLIVTPQEKLPTGTMQKLCENRNWNHTSHIRGYVLIHAGAGTKYWTEEYGLRKVDCPFGAFVGKVNIIDCRTIQQLQSAAALASFPWLKDHVHVEGPQCILWKPEDTRECNPFPFPGKQGFFIVPDSIVKQLHWL